MHNNRNYGKILFVIILCDCIIISCYFCINNNYNKKYNSNINNYCDNNNYTSVHKLSFQLAHEHCVPESS